MTKTSFALSLLLFAGCAMDVGPEALGAAEGALLADSTGITCPARTDHPADADLYQCAWVDVAGDPGVVFVCAGTTSNGGVWCGTYAMGEWSNGGVNVGEGQHVYGSNSNVRLTCGCITSHPACALRVNSKDTMFTLPMMCPPVSTDESAAL